MVRRLYASKVRQMRLVHWALFLALAMGSAGCAFYNTFYLARRYYHQALEEQKKDTTGKLSPAASTKFDQSVKQCSKILQRYGGSKWVDDALFLMGKAYYGKQSYLESRRWFDELIARCPKSPFIPEAQFWIARSYLAEESYERAEEALQKVVTDYPNFRQQDELLYALAETALRQGRHEEAADEFQSLVDRFPKSGRATDALLRLGDARFAQKQYDAARLAYQLAAARTGEPRVRFDARLKVGQSLEAAGQFADALRVYDAAAGELVPPDRLNQILSGADAPSGQAQSGMAGMQTPEQQAIAANTFVDENGNPVMRNPAFANQNQPGTTAQYNPNDLNDPRNPASPSYNPAYGQQNPGGVRPGYPAGTQTGYASASGNMASRQAASAAAAANPLAGELPRVLLRQGLCLSKLDRDDDAIKLFKSVLAAYPRTSEAAEAQYRIGYIQEVHQEDYAAARLSYDGVRQQGPSVFSDQAARRSTGLARLEQLAAADTLKKEDASTAEKEAEKDFLAAELYLFQQEKPEKALEQYALVESNHPRSPFAAKSAMAQAWIYANTLSDSTRAEAAFQHVIDAYPGTDQYRMAWQVLKGEPAPETKPAGADSLLQPGPGMATAQADSSSGFPGVAQVPATAATDSAGRAPMVAMVPAAAATDSAAGKPMDAIAPARRLSRLAPAAAKGLPRPLSDKSLPASGRGRRPGITDVRSDAASPPDTLKPPHPEGLPATPDSLRGTGPPGAAAAPDTLHSPAHLDSTASGGHH